MRAVARRVLRVLKLGAVLAAVAAAIRAIRGRGTEEVTGQASWPPLTEPARTERRSGPVQFAADRGADEEVDTADDSADWVAPVDGICPASHPIKGNEGSGIYHVPGGLSYDRTIPERCYATPEAAEADGFRRSKR